MTSRLPLVLLPGLLCDGALWRHQEETLTDAVETMVADLAGGESVGALAAAVLRAAPESFALAGLSMGGYVAFEIMRQAPDRVTRLALLDTSARADTPQQTERRRALIAMAQQGDFKGVTPRLMPLLVAPDRLADETLTNTVVAMAGRVGRDAFLRQQRTIMGRPDSRGDLRGIRCPTLVLCGRQDALTPVEASAEMATAIPRAALVVIEDCGHLSPLEQPHAVSALLRYWLQW